MFIYLVNASLILHRFNIYFAVFNKFLNIFVQTDDDTKKH